MKASERFQLAQANVARMRAPLEDPLMEGFRSQLEAINALADASPASFGGCRRRTATPRRSAPMRTRGSSSTCRSGNPWRVPTPDAFTFRSFFSPPGEPDGPAPKVDAEFCRA